MNQIYSFQRYSLEGVKDGHNLVLSSVSPSDAGVYTCHISAFHRTELHHTIQVRSMTLRYFLVSLPDRSQIMLSTVMFR